MSEQDAAAIKYLIAHTVAPDVGYVLDLTLDALTTDGAHHKQWYLDQILRLLAGDYYERLREAFAAGDEGVEWEEGGPP